MNKLEQAARQLLEAVEDFQGYRQDIDTAIADLHEVLEAAPQLAALERHPVMWALWRESTGWMPASAEKTREACLAKAIEAAEAEGASEQWIFSRGWLPKPLYGAPQPAAAEQEPVAYLHCGGQFGGELDEWEIDPEQYQCDKLNERFGALGKEARLPLYKAPQPARRPLTSAQIDEIADQHRSQLNGRPYFAWYDYARAIERAHGIGGDA